MQEHSSVICRAGQPISQSHKTAGFWFSLYLNGDMMNLQILFIKQ